MYKSERTHYLPQSLSHCLSRELWTLRHSFILSLWVLFVYAFKKYKRLRLFFGTLRSFSSSVNLHCSVFPLVAPAPAGWGSETWSRCRRRRQWWGGGGERGPTPPPPSSPAQPPSLLPKLVSCSQTFIYHYKGFFDFFLIILSLSRISHISICRQHFFYIFLKKIIIILTIYYVLINRNILFGIF